MEFFLSLTKDPEQAQKSSGENLEILTYQNFIHQTSSHQIIDGSFRDKYDWMKLNDGIKNTSRLTSVPNPSEAPGNKMVQTKQQNKRIKGKNAVKNQTPGADNSQEDNADKGIGPEDENCDDRIFESETSRSFDPLKEPSYPYIPGMRKSPVEEKRSCLDYNEHSECLRLFLKFSKYKSSTGRIAPADRSDNILFEMMYKKIQEEQLSFFRDAQTHWPETAKQTQIVSQIEEEVLQTMYKLRVKKALMNYPHRYRRKLMIPLMLSEKQEIQMTKVTDLLQMGKIPAYLVPTLKTRCRPVLGSHEIVRSKLYHFGPDEVVGSLHKLPVSLDPNAESFARLKQAQIVASFGALKALVEAHFDHSKRWVLPITVKDHRTIEKGRTTTKTVVFIDKPLPRPVMTANECHHLFMKYGICARLIRPRHMKTFEFPIPGVLPLKRGGCTMGASEKEIPETRHNPIPDAEKGKQADGPEVPDDESEDDSCEDERLVIEENAPEEPLETVQIKDEIKTAEGMVRVPENKESSLPATFHRLPTSADERSESVCGRKDGLKLPKTAEGFTAPLNVTNVTYALWTIQPDHDQLSVHRKKVLRELSVIVRCRIDACKRDKEEVTGVSVSAKLEQQVEFTAEDATKDELIREWASLFFKPASHVVRARVDSKQPEVIMFEDKDKAQIAADAQRLYGLRLSDSLQTVYSVFSEISSLGKGSYLLYHSPEENSFASLEESVTDINNGASESVRFLPQFFGQSISMDPEINLPWPKLDCSVILPKHEYFNVMPATYRPRATSKKTFKSKVLLPRQQKPTFFRGYHTQKKKKKIIRKATNNTNTGVAASSAKGDT